MSLSAKSIDLIEAILDDPGADIGVRVKVALRLIEAMGCLDPSKLADVGTSDPSLLEKQWQEARSFSDLFPLGRLRHQ
jgi:hypothetical protein